MHRKPSNGRKYWLRLTMLSLLALAAVPLLGTESNGQLPWFGRKKSNSKDTPGRVARWFGRNKTPQQKNSASPANPSYNQASQRKIRSQRTASTTFSTAQVTAAKRNTPIRSLPQPDLTTEPKRTILPPGFVANKIANQRLANSTSDSLQFHAARLPGVITNKGNTSQTGGSTRPIRQVAYQVDPISPVPRLQTPPAFNSRSFGLQQTQGYTPAPPRAIGPQAVSPNAAVQGPPVGPGSPATSVNGQRQVVVPITPPGLERQDQGVVNLSTHNGQITLTAREATLSHLLAMIAKVVGLNIITTDDASTRISVTLQNVGLEEALTSILSVSGYTWHRRGDIITVSQLNNTGSVNAMAQGRVIKMFPLNFVNATDVEQVVTGLLSPVGKVFSTQADQADPRRSRDSVVVEDLPEYIDRIAKYISEIDQPPRQVQIQAHILQVDLRDGMEHGVDFNRITQVALGRQVEIKTTGFADDSGPGLIINMDRGDLDTVVDAIQSTTDAKTLASPKVMAVNGQESRVQIGGQLGFLQTTTTETATLQNVSFLEVGVVLTVTPYISDDGRILMRVKPEVSNGRINPDTGLPEEETTEVETTVILNDGQGMIIGGLIQETDTDDQNKVPFLGDAAIIGRLFQRRIANRERNEVIIALIPRIVPYDEQAQEVENLEFERATTPLLQGPLLRNARPWEPRLPDACPEGEVVSDSSQYGNYQSTHCPDYGQYSSPAQPAGNTNSPAQLQQALPVQPAMNPANAIPVSPTPYPTQSMTAPTSRQGDSARTIVPPTGHPQAQTSSRSARHVQTQQQRPTREFLAGRSSSGPTFGSSGLLAQRSNSLRVAQAQVSDGARKKTSSDLTRRRHSAVYSGASKSGPIRNVDYRISSEGRTNRPN